jgi:hypothetical protein
LCSDIEILGLKAESAGDRVGWRIGQGAAGNIRKNQNE